MPIDYFVDHKRRLVMVKARGRVRAAEVFDYEGKLRLRRHAVGYRTLMDLSGVEDMDQPSADQIRQLAIDFSRADASGATIRQLAVVAHGDYLFGLARMFQGHCESTVEVSVFRSLDDAADFLGLSSVFFFEGFEGESDGTQY